jgi:hypothetical protein
MRRTRLAIAIPLGLLLGACASPSDGLSGSDDESTFGGLRATWEIPRPTISDGRPPARQWLLEVEAGATSGDFGQALGAGQSLTIDGVTYSGPGAVQARFDVQQLAVDGRFRVRNAVGLGLDAIAGLGFTRLDLETASFGASADLDQQGLGPVLGTGVFFELPPRLRFYAELTWQAAFVGSGDVADVQVFDAGMDLRLTEALGLTLSWRDFAYREERDGAESDLDLNASGPRLTLMLQL